MLRLLLLSQSLCLLILRFDEAGSYSRFDMHGIGGLTVSRLGGQIAAIARYAPTTVILDIAALKLRLFSLAGYVFSETVEKSTN